MLPSLRRSLRIVSSKSPCGVSNVGLVKTHVRYISTKGTDFKPPYGYSSNVNVERLRNKDKQFFTPGPLDPEIQDFKDFKIELKKLFTPGTINVKDSVKEAMMLDVGTRDPQFHKTMEFIRSKLVEIAGVHEDDYSAILLSTDGPTALESVIHTMVPRNGGKVLVLENGSDGQLLAEMCQRAEFDVHVISFPEETAIDVDKVCAVLEQDDTFTNLVMVHCEPSSGMINPVEEIGQLLYFYNPRSTFIVDGGMSFGAIPVDMELGHVAVLVGNAYTCLESVPGICFALASRDALEERRGLCRSLALDLVRSWDKQMKTGFMSYVPSTHSVLGLARALIEFEEEGGVEGRSRRYKKNASVLREGMAKLGFRETLNEQSGFMITSFQAPRHPNYDFNIFLNKLYDRGVLIYQGRGARSDSFRVATIGQINPHDVRFLLRQIQDVCTEMGIETPLKD